LEHIIKGKNTNLGEKVAVIGAATPRSTAPASRCARARNRWISYTGVREARCRRRITRLKKPWKRA
jgi:hypothetical protein